ncbi:alpha/beta hydrolase [Microbacterium sp. cx-55]|uniref:alpha/beta fold hydrolase n=1 Tax=Microbacterium sp. cx-55 TaxID=2875948 RepID=UPI001CC020AC|nr:alpha/beta hydrolase [Microbacterium sp. cx-55]MBZ4486694.1 alpha/beta hydrolase [Microbacterium sp. cx-55]UGB36346.1 alpha/beta hydrolase [Microbacterium sp. cx-55]
MRKPFTIAMVTVAVVVALPVLLLTTTTVVNLVATQSERASITAYGERVPVDGKEMNVVVSGDGPETIVLLPGLGTAAPARDFQPLIAGLDDTHRVIAVEPFGTGLSDQTDVPRTAENIVSEVHEAVHALGVDRYVLMGHSIAGIYALAYSAAYADELIAFVGIDSSVPQQPGGEEPIPTEGIGALRDLGILRALSWLSGEDPAPGVFDAATAEQMQLLSTQNGTAPTMLDEMAHAATNFSAVRDAEFPRTLPVLLFVADDNGDVEGWLDLHRSQAASVDQGRVVVLDGEHYLHHTQSPAIARETDGFLATVSAPAPAAK